MGDKLDWNNDLLGSMSNAPKGHHELAEPVAYHSRLGELGKEPFPRVGYRDASPQPYSDDGLDGTSRYDEAQQFSGRLPYVAAATGGYHEREGYAVASQVKSKGTPLLCVPNSKWQWAFCAIVIAQAIIGLTLECYIFAKFQIAIDGSPPVGPHGRTVPTYLSLFIFGFLYQLILVYDALRMKNTIQVIGLCLYNVGLLVEAGVQSDQIHDAVIWLEDNQQSIDPDFWEHVRPLIVAVPCVIGLALIFMIFVTWKLYHEFEWSIFQDISADVQMRRRFLSYQIYIALLKFDFFFFLAFTVQFLVVVVETSDFEFYLTIAAVPVTILILFLAAYWARRESVPGMLLVIIVYLAGLGYFIFKLVRMYYAPEDRISDYRPARTSLTTFASITLLLLLVTIVYAITVTTNFGNGLKTRIQGLRRRQRGSVELAKLAVHGEVVDLGPGDGRITID